MQEPEAKKSGVPTELASPTEKYCIACFQLIHFNAKRCDKCGALQTWMRHFVAIGVVVAVIVPLVSMFVTLVNVGATQDSLKLATKESKLAKEAAANAIEALAEVKAVSDRLLRVRAAGADRRLTLFLDDFWKDFNESRSFCEQGDNPECSLRAYQLLDEIQEVLFAVVEVYGVGDSEFAQKSKVKVCHALGYFTNKMEQKGFGVLDELANFTRLACEVPLGTLTIADISVVYQ